MGPEADLMSVGNVVRRKDYLLRGHIGSNSQCYWFKLADAGSNSQAVQIASRYPIQVSFTFSFSSHLSFRANFIRQ